jgi:hypothetical protein
MLAVVLTLCAPQCFAQNFVAGVPTQISVGVASTAPNSESDSVAVAPNGNVVAFSSAASNLVANDTNGTIDVFVRGPNGVITLESISGDGIQGDRYSGQVAISQIEPNGSYGVVFVSSATNFVTGLSATELGYGQIYLRLPHLKKTILISRGYEGGQFVGAVGTSERPSVVSLDGGAKYLVAFHSDAFNIVKDAAYTSPSGQYYRRIYFATVTAATGKIEMGAFIGQNKVQAEGNLEQPVLSGFGDSIVFRTDASNMPWSNGKPNQPYQIVLAKKGAGFELISKSPVDGTPGDATSDSASMSFNASKIVFKTYANNIFDASLSGASLVAYDTNTKTYQLVNTTDAGVRGNGFSTDVIRLDPKGRLVCFMDSSDNYLTSGVDTNQRADLFVKDLKTLKISRVNLGSGDVQESDGYTTSCMMGTLGYNSQVATVGFLSSASAFRQYEPSQGREVYRSSITFPPPPLESTSKIESPPDVKPTAPKTLVLTLQKFDVATSKTAKGEIDALTTKLSYDVRVTQTTTKKQKKVTSTKNRLTLRNLTPGKYTVKYRVIGTSSAGKKVSTPFSPAQTVTVKSK